MIVANTYIDKSSIHGIGLFAGEDLPKGSIVWRFNSYIDLCYTFAEWEQVIKSVPLICQKVLYSYYFKEKGNCYICLDNGRFVNHSREYNMQYNGLGELVTNRDVKKDEELTENYVKMYDEDDELLQRKEPWL